VLTRFSKTPQYQISWKSFQSFFNCLCRQTNNQIDTEMLIWIFFASFSSERVQKSLDRYTIRYNELRYRYVWIILYRLISVGKIRIMVKSLVSVKYFSSRCVWNLQAVPLQIAVGGAADTVDSERHKPWSYIESSGSNRQCIPKALIRCWYLDILIGLKHLNEIVAVSPTAQHSPKIWQQWCNIRLLWVSIWTLFITCNLKYRVIENTRNPY
jgi:hypothetical protein